MIAVAELYERFPKIHWGEPIKIARVDGVQGWACRICIAQKGLRADEIQNLYRSPEACRRHIELAHD